MRSADLAVIGGGIVGLATAWRFGLRYPGARAVVLEKEDGIVRHQTGHNSGVIHSGIYYKPGSAKAATCRRGKRLLEDFCRERGVPFETCGKVVVAVEERERPMLERIHERALANGVACEAIGPERLREREPHAAGVAALFVPETGIVDYVAVGETLASLVREQGGEVVPRAKVTGVRADGARVRLLSTAGEVEARAAVNCAGLHSDRVLERSGLDRPARIVPFRGEYYELCPEARGFCKSLIYPVPDPSFPFLGVHFTRTIGGGVECGPNAVLALAREGYTWRDVDLRDLYDVFSYPGFWRLAARHFRTGAAEVVRSLSKPAFTRALRRLLPAIEERHLLPAPAGVRAQALFPDGALVDDFLIRVADRVVHVLNAPSPAATASLAIGDLVVDEVATLLPRETSRNRNGAVLR
jgi:L-2-hydroxyglutarate oxidase